MINLGFGKKGFGPNSWGWIRILIPYEFRFYEGSIRHDHLYTIGGNEEDRERADQLLLCDMINSCETDYQRLWAGRYYLLLRKFGKYFFKYKFAFKV